MLIMNLVILQKFIKSPLLGQFQLFFVAGSTKIIEKENTGVRNQNSKIHLKISVYLRFKKLII